MGWGIRHWRAAAVEKIRATDFSLVARETLRASFCGAARAQIELAQRRSLGARIGAVRIVTFDIVDARTWSFLTHAPRAIATRP
jgi:hypothetical protein